MKKYSDGFSIFEYLVALIIVTIAFLSWLQLTVTTVQNGAFVKRLADVGSLSSSKASEVLKNAEKAFADSPPTVQTVGTIAPHAVSEGYYDLLDRSGRVLTSYQSKSEIGFVRQWMIVRDLPVKGGYSVYVSVVCMETRRLMRLAKATKIDGIER